MDLFPRVEFPVVTVTTVLEGASPETMEREVSQVLEDGSKVPLGQSGVLQHYTLGAEQRIAPPDGPGLGVAPDRSALGPPDLIVD